MTIISRNIELDSYLQVGSSVEIFRFEENLNEKTLKEFITISEQVEMKIIYASIYGEEFEAILPNDVNWNT